MSTEVGRAHVTIGAETSGLKRGVTEARTSLKSFANEVPGLGNALSLITNPLVAVGAGLTTFAVVAKQSITAASNLNETMSKTKVIFGDAADVIIDQSKGMASAAGLSEQAFLDAASTFGIFGKSAGLTGDELAGFSTDLSVLAADMASFSNTTPEEAILALGAALRGETEPIRRYGVLLDDMTLRQKAMELGITDTTTKALLPQQRVLAAQAVIFEQTGDAQGDFARTSDQLANQQRILKAELENVKVEIGEKLYPAAKDITVVFVDFIEELIGTYKAADEATAALKRLREEKNKYGTDEVDMGVFSEDEIAYIREGGSNLLLLADIRKRVTQAFKDGLATEDEFEVAQNLSIAGTKEWADALESINKRIDNHKHAVEGATASLVPYSNYVEGNSVTLEKNKRYLDLHERALLKERDATRAAAEETKKNAEIQVKALHELSDSFWLLDEALGGELKTEMENYNESQADIAKQMADVKDEIDKAISQGYDPLGEKVQGLQGDYDTLSGKMEENAQRHEDAVNLIIFNLAREQLALDGIDPSAQLDMLNQLAESLGLTDDKGASAAVAVKAVMDNFKLMDQTDPKNMQNWAEAMDYIAGAAQDGEVNAGELQTAIGILGGEDEKLEPIKKAFDDVNAEVDDGIAKVGTLQSRIDGLTDKKVYIDIYEKRYLSTVYDPTGSGTVVHEDFASGVSNFIVPPFYPNDSYKIGVSSGEVVNVSTPGQQTYDRNGSGGGGVTIDTININAGAGADGNLIYLQFKRALEADMRNANRAGIPYSNR